MTHALFTVPYYTAFDGLIVCAKGRCGGRPTVGQSRFEIRHVLDYHNAGSSPEEIAQDYVIPLTAVKNVLEIVTKLPAILDVTYEGLSNG